MSRTYSFKYDEVPYEWPICFNDNCERKGTCLRRQAALLAAEVARSKTRRAMCITPLAYSDDECGEYVEATTERMAWGFTHFYDHVQKMDYPRIKEAIVKYLRGMSNYYRYRNGEKMLNERQQQRIAEIFQGCGYNEPVCYDHYELKTVFPFK